MSGNGMTGLVTRATGSWYQVRLTTGHSLSCRMPGKFRLSEKDIVNPLAVGDRVDVREQSDGTGMIDRVHDRKNRLERKATHGRRGIQILASNVDLVVVVQSLRDPVVKAGFIDRVLVSSEACGIPSAIVLNKMDLQTGKKDKKRGEDVRSIYPDLGYSLLETSIHRPVTIRQLHDMLENRISVLTGHSGTGKTSLLNSLSPDLNLKTGEVSSFSNKGKHTTTFAQLIELSDETFIVDTPGIREFGLVDFEPYEISHYFPEMKPFIASCRYHNCTHRHEPDCAVKIALEAGTVSPSRYRSYLNILESIEQESFKAF